MADTRRVTRAYLSEKWPDGGWAYAQNVDRILRGVPHPETLESRHAERTARILADVEPGGCRDARAWTYRERDMLAESLSAALSAPDFGAYLAGVR